MKNARYNATVLVDSVAAPPYLAWPQAGGQTGMMVSTYNNNNMLNKNHAFAQIYVLPNNSTRPSADPNLLVALQRYCPYWRFSIVITLTVVSVSSSAVAKCEIL